MIRVNVNIKGINLTTLVIDTTDKEEALQIARNEYKNCEVVFVEEVNKEEWEYFYGE